MSELMEQAKKEGIEMPGQKPESMPDAKEAAPSPANQEKPSQADAQPVQPKVESPDPQKRFEDNPGFKNVLRQRDSVREELKKAQEANQKLMSLLEAQSKKTEVAPQNEQETAAKQLRQLLGIDDLVSKLETLDKRNSESSQTQREAAFDKEEAQILSQCQKFGLNPQEVLPELQGWLEEHPYFSRVGEIQPGFYDIAFKALYFDKSSELAKRAAYAEQLKETEKLKKATSEAPSPAHGNTPSAYTGVKDKVRELIEKAGGISFPGQ